MFNNDKLSSEYLAEWLHNTYEEVAKENNWNTQENCKVEFDNLPEANKNTMIEVSNRLIKFILTETDLLKNMHERVQEYCKYVFGSSLYELVLDEDGCLIAEGFEIANRDSEHRIHIDINNLFDDLDSLKEAYLKREEQKRLEKERIEQLRIKTDIENRRKLYMKLKSEFGE